MANYVEIEVKAKTVDLAVEAAMQELGVEDKEQLSVEVVSHPVKGFLGMGGRDAVVRVKRRRNRSPRSAKNRPKSRQQQGSGRNRPRGDTKSVKNGGKSSRPDRRGRSSRPSQDSAKKERNVPDDRPLLSLEDQAQIANKFLVGMVDAYGLEGTVTTVIDDEVIVADVRGDQTEALVGVRGSVRSAIHELTRTVLQKHAQDAARCRLDIAGYAERRRQALSIYAGQLIGQLNAEGGEIMLEPMSPADRKVIHDAAAEHDGIESYSEGDPPRRYVVLSKVGAAEEE